MPSEIKPEYRPRTPIQRLGYLIEECGEVLAACGKTVRHGWDNYNPELPEDQRETNLQWILRELVDLKRAIALFEEDRMRIPMTIEDKLRERHNKDDYDPGPYVCPGCYAMGSEPHAAWCTDWAIDCEDEVRLDELEGWDDEESNDT